MSCDLKYHEALLKWPHFSSCVRATPPGPSSYGGSSKREFMHFENFGMRNVMGIPVRNRKFRVSAQGCVSGSWVCNYGIVCVWEKYGNFDFCPVRICFEVFLYANVLNVYGCMSCFGLMAPAHVFPSTTLPLTLVGTRPIQLSHFYGPVIYRYIFCNLNC